MMLRKTYSNENVYLAVLILLSLLVYAPVLNNFFVSDDLYLVYFSKEIAKDPSKLFVNNGLYEDRNEYVSNAFFRPVTNMLVTATYLFSGLSPFGYHIFNIAFHISCTVLVFLLILGMTGNSEISFVSSLFFSINSTQSDAVIWIGGNHQLVCAFFYLLTLLLWQQYLAEKGENEKKALPQMALTKATLYYAASLAVFILALFVKETSITLVAALMLYECLLVRPSFWSCIRDLKAFLIKYIPFIILSLVYLGLDLFFVRNSSLVTKGGYHLGMHIVVNIIKYLVAFVTALPSVDFVLNSPQILLSNFPSLGILVPVLKAGIAVLLVVIPLIYLYLLFFGSRLIKYCCLFMLITLLPVSLFVNIGVTSRYAYLPSLGYVLILSVAVHKLLSKKIVRERLFIRNAVILGIVIFCLVNVAFININERIFASEGEETKMIITDIMHSYPVLEANTTIYFINAPFFLKTGYPNSHLTELLRLYYGNPTLKGIPINGTSDIVHSPVNTATGKSQSTSSYPFLVFNVSRNSITEVYLVGA